MKEFVAHRHCIALMHRRWRGEYKHSEVILPERFSRPTLRSTIELPLW